MGFLDLLGLGASQETFLKDYRNAYKFRPDVNPARQKFQGYVNFVFNRDLFELLYADPSDGSKEFRTTISSLVRTAELPSVTFRTETKNAYNRKKIVNTGVEYQPVNMTVYDTVGNEWLSVFMKYFSYHYMDPRNTNSNAQDRDIANSELRTGGAENIGSQFLTEVFDSNRAGYNPNLTANFFERIDYVLYHGNKGMQYSIINPVMTSFKAGNLDYSDSGFREFDMTFEYERFTTHQQLNFGLSEEDVDRFEDARQQVVEVTPSEELLSMQGQNQRILQAPRTGQQVPGSQVTIKEDDGTESTTTQEHPDAFVVQAEADSRNGDIRNTYGSAATFAGGTSQEEDNPFLDLLGDVATAGIDAALRDRNIEDAAKNVLFAGTAQIIGDAFNNSDGGDT